MIGTRLAQYVIESQIGAGGMGVVYRAFDSRLERPVAIKVFPDLGADPIGRKRLLHEARSASALNHPNVCTVYEVGESDDKTYLVMEYIEGHTLSRLIPAGGLPIETIVLYGSQIASALAHAHARGVVHRDLKSANIVVTPDERAKVLDFGIALRHVDATVQSDTIAHDSIAGMNTVVGTVPYMSPEALRGDRVDARSDIWALGIMLCEMAGAALPFQGKTVFETVGQILNDPPKMPAQTPLELRPIIQRCLDKDPTLRYQDAGQVRAAIESMTTAAITVPPAAFRGEPGDTPRAVLVLPFANVSPDQETDYFSDGLTDEIIADLSNVSLLRVISRTSSMQLKGTSRTMGELAHQLGVGYVLEGSVRRAGSQLRITAKLIDVERDSPVWGQKYGGTLDDVFSIQETISRSIVDALRLTLTTDESRRLAEHPIRNVRAYEWYLRAKQEMLRFTEEGLDRALDYLDKASEVEGENILLLAARGDVYWQYVNAGISADSSSLDKAEACARQVLAIDPASPHGYRISGLVRVHRGDVDGALQRLKQALEMDANDIDSLFWGSQLAAFTGQIPLAEAWAARLVEIDPVTPLYQVVPGVAAWLRGDYEAARRTYAAHSTAIMENPVLRLVYGQILIAAGQLLEGGRVLEELARALPDNPFAQLAHAYYHALRGDRARVSEVLTPALVGALEGDPQYCWSLAQCQSLAGNVDEGIRWIEAAVARGFTNYPLLADLDPLLVNLRSDPRYVALMTEVERHWRARLL